MTEMFMVMGFLTAICAGWLLIIVAVVNLSLMTNWTLNKVVDTYGGWRTYRQFQRWYREHHIKEQK